MRFQLLVQSCLAVPAAALALVCAAPSAFATPAATTTTLAITAGGSAVTTVASGTAVTLTATVLAGSTPVTQGLVNFCDATAAHCQDIHIVGQASLSGLGTAVVKLRPGPGSHSYQAVLVGNSGYAASSSAAAALAVTATTGYPSTTSLTATGSAGNYTLTSTVFGNSPAAPTGTISFLDSNHSNAVLTTAPLVAGTTMFNFATSQTASLSGTVQEVIADLNGDGIPDVVVAENEGLGGDVAVLLGNGDGTFTPKPSLETNANWWNSVENVVVADFNGDGIPDVAITDNEFSDQGPGGGFVEIFLGNGDGTFTATPGELIGFGPQEDPQTGTLPYATVVGDFNGDGIPDIAVANLYGSLNVFLGNGDGTVKSITGASGLAVVGQDYEGDEPTPGSIAVGDFNGDGIQDLAVLNNIDGVIYLLLGNGDGTFAAGTSPATVNGGTQILSADFNGDGIPDLAVGGLSGVLLGNGNGTFTLKASSPAVTVATFSAVADFNGDGIADIISQAGLYLGHGDGTFTSAAAQSIPGGVLAVADLNGDGIPDLAESNGVFQLTEGQAATATATAVAVTPATGAHTIVASFPAEGSYAASTSAPVSLTAAQGTPTVSVTTSATAPVIYGTTVTFTATVTGGGLPPTGTISLFSGTTLFAEGISLTNGVATYSTPSLAVGTDAITAQYSGDANYTALTSSPVQVTVNGGATPTVRLYLSSDSVPYGSQVTFTSVVFGAGGGATGTVSFLAGSTVLGSGKLADGTTSFSISTLTPGPYSITASYGGDGNYAPAVSPAKSLTVNLLTPTLTFTGSSGSILVGAPVTFSITAAGSGATPTGGVIFLNGADQIGSGTLDANGSATMTTSALPLGIDPITVNYSGDASYAAATTVAFPVSVRSAPTASTTTLAIDAGGSAVTSVAPGTVVTLTATVKNGTTPVTAGAVNFCDASAAHCQDIHIVGTAQLTSAGTASLNFRPGIGSHSYKAEFAGLAYYPASVSPSSSAAAALTVTTPSGGYLSFSQVAESGDIGNYTLTASVGGAGPTAPTGTLSFVDTTSGNSVLTTAALTPSTGPIFRFETSITPGGTPTTSLGGDFNNDGKTDVVTLNNASPGSVMMMLGNGGGTFAKTTSTTLAAQPEAFTMGDFNRDGNLDLAVTELNQTVAILLGKGDGTFTTSSLTLPAGANPGEIVAADFNGDGILDLAVATYQQNDSGFYIAVFLGKGDGTFSLQPVMPSAGYGFNGLVAEDFNGDGFADLAVLNSPSSANPGAGILTILLGEGNGAFSAGLQTGPSQGGFSMVSADFNGDGIPDLAWSSGGCEVQVLQGNGDGTFLSKSAVTTSEGCYETSLAVGDFNGDGIPDLAEGGDVSYGDIGTLLGNGDSTFTAGPTWYGNSTSEYYATNLLAADLNGDGISDLLFVGGSQQTTVTELLTEAHASTATVTGIAIEPVGAGPQQVEASYPGDSTYAASVSSPTTLLAALGAPTVNLAESPNPAAYGASVTLTATITGSGAVPAGTVAFYDGQTLLSTVTLNASGVASYSSTKFSVGAHSITADYSGNNAYNAATSAASTLNVNPATGVAAVTVTPSASSITGLQALTVGVTVTVGAGDPAPVGTVTLTSGSYTSATVTLSGGSASFTIPAGTLQLGSNTLTVTYGGSATYPSASGTAVVTVTKIAPAVTVTPASSSINAEQSLKVTIAASGGSGAPAVTGTVTLTSGAYTSAATTLTSGSASITIPAGTLAAGSDTLTATYSPDTAGSASYTTATGTSTVTVTKITPTVTVAPASASITTVQTDAVTVTVSGGSGNPVAAGTVTLTSGTYTSAATALASGSATITIPAAALAVGADTLTAAYAPGTASAAVYQAASGTASVTVSKATPTVAATPTSVYVTTVQSDSITVAVSGGAGSTAPTGTVTLSSGTYSSAATALAGGSASITIPAGTLPLGANTITASYSGDGLYAAASGTTSVTVSSAIGTAAPTVTVTPASLYITNEQTDAIAITVAGASGTPTGTVTLASGSYSATASLSSGAASITIPAGALTAGPDTLTASYSGDPTYATGKGTAVVTVSELTSTAPAPSTVSPGGSATPTVTIAASSTYSGTLNLACKLTASPTGALSLPTCSLKPTTVTFTGGGSGSTVLTVATTAASTTALAEPARKGLWGLGGGSVLAVLLMCGIPARRRRFAGLLALVWIAVVSLAIGCGGGSSGSGGGSGGTTIPATTAGSYTFTVTGTDSANSSITTSTTVKVTVN